MPMRLHSVPGVFGQQPQPAAQALAPVQYHVITVKIAVAFPPGGNVGGNVHDAGVLHGMHDPAGRDHVAGLCPGNTAGVLPIVGPDEELGDGQAVPAHGLGTQKQRDKPGHDRRDALAVKTGQVFVGCHSLQVHGLVSAVWR